MIPAQQHPNYYHNRSNQSISKEPSIQKQSQVSHIKSMQITKSKRCSSTCNPGAQAQHKNNKSKGERTISQLNHEHLESKQQLKQEHLASDQQLQVGGGNSGCSPQVHAIL